MKMLKPIGFTFIGLAILGIAAFTFAKIQKDQIPTFTITWYHVQHSVAIAPRMITQDDPVAGKVAHIVPATLQPIAVAADSSELNDESADDATAPPDSDSVSVKSMGGVPVLMYHYVGDLPANADAVRKDLTVSTQNFNAQVTWLKSQGYQSITMNQLYAWITKGTSIPAKSVVFTFDDGYMDVFQNAVPILEANHMTGSFGIITGLVAGSVYATWPEISTAHSQGMEIVSHSYSHPDFSTKSETDQTYEITKSDSDFQANLGFVPDYFIYPYGKYNATTISLLKANEFVMAFTTAYGYVHPGENMLELPRVRVHGAETLPTFESAFGATVQK
jgi:peptidoglycan/xylan/chitin deacetylase (PgdA/CDA1 family)